MGRDFFLPPALEVAPNVLGAVLSLHTDAGTVAIRITEVEAYHGLGTPGPYDAGSHSKDRRTNRNASMFGPPGHAYVYFTYGMHYAINLVCSPEGTASGILLRAGEVIAGRELAVAHRARKRPELDPQSLASHQIARGPGNLAAALQVTREQHDGRDVFSPPFTFVPAISPPERIASGPRVGVAGEAGSVAFPWRFWIAGDPTVSSYRPGRNVPR